MVPSVATPLCGTHTRYPSIVGCYISRCHLARLSTKHMPFGANAVRGTLAEQAFGSAANTFVLQLYMQQHSHFVNAYAFSGGLRGGSVQYAYLPVAAMLFGHVCTIDLVDLLPCCCYTSAVQFAMTSVLGRVFLQCLCGQATLPAQSNLSSMFRIFCELFVGGWSMGSRPAESAVFV